MPNSSLMNTLRRGLIVAAFNVLIGIGLAIRNEHPLIHMAYAQAIGLSIWLCAEAGRIVFARDSEEWPEGWRRWLVLAASIPTGYVIGTGIGDAFCGCSTWDQVSASPRVMAGYLFLSLTATGAVSYFLHSRGRRLKLERLAATAQRDAAENQLRLLASQLEPHMLFNTLANLRVLITLDPPKAQAMLDHLIAFLRTTLTASRGTLHTLGEEFVRIGDYLALMKLRMGDRLQASTELPPSLKEHAVPTLLLQPLVENAIKHGLEPKVAGGQLSVTAHHDGDTLLLQVRDTGVGLSDAHGDGTHFGITHVRQRLATLYGSTASLTLRTEDGATLASVRIPLKLTN